MDLTIVIPCLNEEKSINICIKKCKQAFNNLYIDAEIIIVDNGSTDSSVKIATEAGAKVIHCENKGYGNALKCGLKYAQGKYIIMGDADNTYDFSQISNFYNKAINDSNIDMIIGSRLKGNIQKGAMPFMHRYIGSPIITSLINLLYKTKISDSQSGMRLFKKTSLENINFETSGMEFATEQLVKFKKNNMNIVEIPINFYKSYEGRIPHLKPIKDGCRILIYLIKSKLSK